MSEYIYQSHGEPLVNERGEIYLARAGEIVRCRDCDHGLFGGKTCDRLDPGFDEYWFEVEPDGFCAWAERRTDE